MAGLDVDGVSALVHRVATDVVMPRWRSFAEFDVDEKSPGEFVTVVDRAAEALLTRELGALLPGAVVVGEEAAASDTALVHAVAGASLVWLVDPLDGTRNFVDGSPDFAVMVALVEEGETIAAWIELPASGGRYVAERGSGAFVNGRRLRHLPASGALADLRGAALTRFLDDEQRQGVLRLADVVAEVGPGKACAGVDYSLLAEGQEDFVLFWRTLPWDHAPGALVLSEAGGVIAHLDGVPYRPGGSRPGLLAASDPAAHAAVLAALSM